MMIATKFNVGDTVWCMRDNKPIQVCITFLRAVRSKSNNYIKYGGDRKTGSHSYQQYTDLDENTLFKTKADLLGSL